MEKKIRVLTGLTPSGHFTIGNYFGALKPIVKYLKEGNEVFVFVANLHGLSIPNDITPAYLHQNTMELLLILEAMGIHNGIKNCYVYIQSEHQNNLVLGTLMQLFSNMGELERMTQYKDKKKQLRAKNKTFYCPTGLLTYPTLMAADILLYSPDIVPVGNDQKQHLELTKILCNRINNYVKKTVLNLPTFLSPSIKLRIKSLTDPNKKMSKSSKNPNDSIFLLDSAEDIEFKISKAKTDSYNQILANFQLKQAGVNNLLDLYSLTKNSNDLNNLIKEINNDSVPYKMLKEKVTNALINEIKTIHISIKNHLQLTELNIRNFENFFKKHPHWHPPFLHDETWKRKNHKIQIISNKLIMNLLNELGLLI